MKFFKIIKFLLFSFACSNRESKNLYKRSIFRDYFNEIILKAFLFHVQR